MPFEILSALENRDFPQSVNCYDALEHSTALAIRLRCPTVIDRRSRIILQHKNTHLSMTTTEQRAVLPAGFSPRTWRVDLRVGGKDGHYEGKGESNTTGGGPVLDTEGADLANKWTEIGGRLWGEVALSRSSAASSAGKILLNVFDTKVTRAGVRPGPLLEDRSAVVAPGADFDAGPGWVESDGIALNKEDHQVEIAFPEGALEAALVQKDGDDGDLFVVTVFVEFVGNLNDEMCGFYRSTYSDGQGNSKVMLTTQMEPAEACRAFPCFGKTNSPLPPKSPAGR
jgi:Peptidase M1 N-terminal domain